MPVAERSLAELASIRLAAQRALCEQSFPDFLTYLRIRSDDPDNPELEDLDPWPFQLERAAAWQAGAWEIILKERQTGFSSALVAPFFLWCAMYRRWQCAYTSVDQPAARKEVARIKALYESLPKHLRVPGAFRTDDAEFEGGGGFVAFASTDHAGVSYTFQLWAQDEAGFHPYGAENFAAILPAVANGQVIILSTANPNLGPSGHFHDLYWASKRGETRFTAVFEARRRPDRDAAWYAQTRRAYAGKEDEFDAYYPETDAAAFVARSGLVYPQFVDALHVQPARIPLDACSRAIAGVDWGGGDPTAIVIIGLEPARKHVHQYADFSKPGSVSVLDIAAFIRQYPTVRQVRCGIDEPVAITTLQNTLGPSYDVTGADVRRAEGLGLIGQMLADSDLIEVGRRRLTIEPSCGASIAEFPGYRWMSRTDPNDRTRYATKTPVDHHADCMDARRYATMEMLALLTMDQPPPLPRSARGAPLATVMR